MARLFVTNGRLVTADPLHTVVPHGFVCVEDGAITQVVAGPAPAPGPGDEVLDAEGALVLPGLVNAHTHVPMSLFRGLADDLPLMEWLNGHMFPAEAAHVNPENARAGALLSCAEMLLSGTTCFCDGYFEEGAVAEAVAETGLRAVLGHGVIDHPAPGVPDPARNVETALAFVREWSGRHPLIRPSVFCHAPYTCSEDTLRRAREAAREAGVLFQIHVAETRHERDRFLSERGMTSVAWLDRLGVLGTDTLAVHCVWVDVADVEILARTDTAVALATESNMKLASGTAPVPRLLAAGVRAGLGTDGPASNNDADMFGEMAQTARLQKLATGDPTAVDARTALALATRDSASALGLSDVCGALAPGLRGDIVVMRADSPRLVPVYDPHSALVYSATGADVRHVVVDGRVVVRDREITTFDVRGAMDRVRAAAERVAGRRLPGPGRDA